jgi:excisionase family DNA binding protein
MRNTSGAGDFKPAPSVISAKRGFSRVEAAFYVGVSATTFDKLVADGRMPKAKQIGGRKVWDRREIDLAFDELGSKDGSWDGVGEDKKVS